LAARAQPKVITGGAALAEREQPGDGGEAPKAVADGLEWTAEHAAQAADALEGAYSHDFSAEALPPEARTPLPWRVLIFFLSSCL